MKLLVFPPGRAVCVLEACGFRASIWQIPPGQILEIISGWLSILDEEAKQ
jgi:hypothetical protein